MNGKLVVVLVVLALAQYTGAENEFCRYFSVRCLWIDPDLCKARGGVFIYRGSFCGLCDICPKYVGLGQSCKDDDPYQPPKPTCVEPLICDRDSKKCVMAPASDE
ncbi:uncharacterized protein LOC126336550 [Schistocerca gregaria]|uniref:uncharacterized protein LOC126336550 n=1 Tax=Schistocerca gregaria TaxID=7010 RepID=UPI00211E327A|nr:uncharacterized protein LOC126336550 [Schistocerca gregaria]